MSKKEDIRKDLGRVKALDVLQNTEGGKLLVKSLLTDMVSSIQTIAYNFQTLSHIELVSNCAKLRERFEMYKTLQNASKNRKIAESDLTEALKEDPDPTE